MPIPSINPSEILKLDDFSAFLGLIGIILSIQSSQIIRRGTTNSKELSDKVITVSVFIAACSNFIDLGTAKLAYDKLKESDKPVSKRKLKAAEDLLTSRVFSVMAVLYLIRATLEAAGLSAVEGSPAPAGAI